MVIQEKNGAGALQRPVHLLGKARDRPGPTLPGLRDILLYLRLCWLWPAPALTCAARWPSAQARNSSCDARRPTIDRKFKFL